jgi:hypothetical protein
MVALAIPCCPFGAFWIADRNKASGIPGTFGRPEALYLQTIQFKGFPGLNN